MKNFEHYKDVFMDNQERNLECIASKEILKRKCDDCTECNKFVKKWLYEEYKEPIKLTDDERSLLKIAFNLGYRWIAKDKGMKCCSFFLSKPIYDDNDKNLFCEYSFNGMFEFVKWEDEEPYNIEELIKED